ncbi:class II fumarate hydratase [Planosporangium sp. 12N6]|uniref:class II fumarate hydratase n=1 Tax=Planosporangium spinosum TaxID=3402278 RepID=UPI003CF13EB8
MSPHRETHDGNVPTVHDLPVGIDATGTRTETDALGAVEVPADRYWGAQTQRSLRYFGSGDDRMPKEIYHAYGYVKKAATIINGRAGRLPLWKTDLITRVADEVIAGTLDSEFILNVWQIGSGAQPNMNLNEVIANRAIQLTGGQLGSKTPVHPNDDVNMSQSSNDTFPTAMHVAAVTVIAGHLLPAAIRLHDATAERGRRWDDAIKIGRTHLQDATPLTVGQEWSGYAAQLEYAIEHLTAAVPGLFRLAMGGTAVGTGLNAPPGFGADTANVIAELTGRPFVCAPNTFAAQASLDTLVRTSAALRGLAVALFKFANDLRWLGSGPRTGLGELRLPADGPVCSMMPGKVNPPQAEAMLMVCIQVMGSDTAVAMAGSQGNFELNAFGPIIIGNVLHSARMLADAADHVREFLVEGAELNDDQLRRNVDRSVMMVTALAPVIGYDRASEIARLAVDNDLPLRQAALQRGVREELFDRIVVPVKMARPSAAGVAAT